LIVLLAGLSLLPWRRVPFRLSRVQAAVVVALLGGAHFLALHVNIRRYVTGAGEQSLDLAAGAEWWGTGLPLSPTVVWLIGSVAFAALAVVLVREMSRDHERAS